MKILRIILIFGVFLLVNSLLVSSIVTINSDIKNNLFIDGGGKTVNNVEIKNVFRINEFVQGRSLNVSEKLKNLLGWQPLIACHEDWQIITFNCSKSDNYLKVYEDLNNCGTSDLLPADNGTISYCDYCSEEIIGVSTDCNQQGKTYTSYYDYNYSICCQETNLSSDCEILFAPYNETLIENCSYEQEDFDCVYDNNPFLTGKINVVCELPDDNYCCLVNVYKDDILLSSNPEREEDSSSLIGKTFEPRTCFKPENTLMNGYYTNKNIRDNRVFAVKVECESVLNNSKLEKSYLMTAEYESADIIGDYVLWMKNNVSYLITAMILILVILVFLGVFLRRTKR